jgi:predicted GNAT family acetyltransferase
MEFRVYEDPQEFANAVGPFLEKEEATNNMLLALLENVKSRTTSEEMPLMCAIFSSEGPQSVAIQFPRLPMVISESSTEALNLMAAGLKSRSLVGVVAPARTSEAFSKLWSARQGLNYKLGMDQSIFQLSQVERPLLPQGRIKKCTVAEEDLITRWMIDFYSESMPYEHHKTEVLRDVVLEKLSLGNVFVWQVDVPTCMSIISGETPNGMRVGYVYTPQKFRKRGYATALVAEQSQYILDQGKKFCFLYTDRSNPTSNGIYQKIGYQMVAHSQHYVFE